MKIVLKYIFTAPKCAITLIKGADEHWSDLATFFRYFPFGVVHKNKSVRIRVKKQSITMSYGHMKPINVGTLGNNEYRNFHVADKVVVDIGASIGDTAILFALSGAKRVFAYELNLKSAALADINIEQNNLCEKIELVKSGVAGREILKGAPLLTALAPEDELDHLNYDDFITLDQIVQDKKIDGGALKIDVDGYEYEIIASSSPQTLKKFQSIFLEYHFGVQDLCKKLEESGFTTNVTPVNKMIASWHHSDFQAMDIGYITAQRKIN